MGCSTFEGDPPLSVGCRGCDFAHLPGMLCREQRTALTTAKARGENKRDLGQVTLRLTAPVESAPTRALEGRRKNALTCDNQEYSTASSIFDSASCCPSSSSSPAECCRQSQAPGSTTEDGRFSASCSSFKSSSAKSSTSTKRSSHKSLKFYCPKLSEVILWGCLLGLMQSACARAAPTRHPALSPPKSGKMEVQNGAALWINPCGIGAEDLMPQDAEIPNVSDKELLNQIVVQAKNALSEADRNKVDYVKKTFKVDYDEHHKSWKQQHYDWLPSHEKIPKVLGEEVPADHLKKIENNLDGTLADSYEYLQTFAVGLEQVARDQRNNASPFKDLFTGAEYKLRAVLCEIQVAIIERNAERRPDITRDIMKDEFRNLDDSYRNLRDWFIYRDYMNALEYVIKVFEFYSSKMP